MKLLPILRLAGRYIRRRLLQSVLFVLGVALGVAMVIAIDLANGSAQRAFELSTQSVAGKATHQIEGSPSGLPSELYHQVRIELGIRESAPIIERYVRSDDLRQPVRVLGVDNFAEAPFRDFLNEVEIQSGKDSTFDALNAFLTESGSVLISQTLANRYGFQVGDTFTIQPSATTVTLKIVGLLLTEDSTSAQAVDDLVLVDIATAQALFDMNGKITRIDLILPIDANLQPLLDRLPSGARLVSLRGNDTTLSQMTRAFEINLQALSLLALVVGAFLIYNTVMFNVVQRRPIIGTLRSLGATQRTIFTLILSEALLLGLIGTVVGIGLGAILGRGAVSIVSQSISNLYYTVNIQSVVASPFTLLKGSLIGLAISTIAAIIPSWDATRTAPAGVMRRSALEDQTRQLLPYITALAVCLNLVGLGLLFLPTRSIVVSFIALFAIVLGGALFTPILLVGVMRAITPIMSRAFGLLGRMAPRAVERSLSRTSVAVAALTIAVSVIVGVSVMISSFRSSVADWLTATLSADIYISAPQLTATQASIGFADEVVQQVASVAGVVDVSVARAVQVIDPTQPTLPPINLTAVLWDTAQERRRFAWYTAPTPNHQDALNNGQVMVSEAFAFKRGITRSNASITLLTDQGEQVFEVFGVFYDYSSDQGTVFIGLDTYRQFWNDRQVSSIAAYVAEPSQLDSVIETLKAETLAGYDLIVQSNRTLRDGVFAVFDQAFSITVALRLLATIVAFIGILSALLSLQLENTRQYGLMRAIGLTPQQLGQFTLLQTGLMGLVAGLLAVPIGMAVAAVLVFVINIRSFGWSMGFIPLPAELTQAFSVSLVAALLAGVYPAWKLSHLVTARALRAE